ncbi:Lrp/AsnC family transcriptional regulator [Pseudorhizobium endolithicum]|uniref:Lrp/AsnC family transcriptional regulator n=1 Tax=Pseudorhizobium endolithicum TaxID=1191678 RepID=A0ABM8PFD0_9HYPH|nr:Lrp/AsnC family transcriptional regulator [Pseudorhizobium endolithicum]CAD7026914.1 Lrp/AsnC family transcriptional regulator [Pseudorhizobium endolithicum]
MPKLDVFDIAILNALQEDARASNVDVAERVNLSPSPCLRRTRMLEEAGIVRGYRAEIDRRAVGLELTIFVAFKVIRHTRENAKALEQALLDIPEVIACHMISGQADFLAEVVVENLAAYERLLTEKLLVLPQVTDIQSNFAIRSVKTGGPLKLPPARERES